MTSSIFDVKVKGLPNEDIIQGFPGINATKPRLEGTVEIRSRDGNNMTISLITAALYRTDTAHLPSNKPGISGPKKEQSFLVGDKVTLFQASTGKSHEDVIALDLPLLIYLPTSRPLPVSFSLGKSIIETTYRLFISIVHSRSMTEHLAYPIRIKRYDTLSTFGTFQVPVGDRVSSTDHIAIMEYSIPSSSVGPTDVINAYISINGNPDWKAKSRKIKIQRITMSIIEVVTFNVEGDEKMERRRRVCKEAIQVDEKIPEEGYTTTISLEFPQARIRDKDGLIYKERPEIPLGIRSGCTTTAGLYKVEYLVVIKARLAKAKDIEIEQPITVTPFDHATCVSFMKSIADSVQHASLGKHESSTPTPKIHYTSNAQSALLYGKPGSIKGSQLLVK